MRNALILHGTHGNSSSHWFPWLKSELEKMGYRVWVPDLPHAERPNVKRYTEFINSGKEFEFNEETIIIGHSSGAVAILGILQNLTKGVKVNSVHLVGSFKDNLGRDELSELFDNPFDFEIIKTKSGKFIFFHSDDDPYCPLEQAKFLVEKTNGELVFLPGQKHFNIGTAGEKYKQFPELLEKIKLST